jgi:hypothetical protein
LCVPDVGMNCLGGYVQVLIRHDGWWKKYDMKSDNFRLKPFGVSGGGVCIYVHLCAQMPLTVVCCLCTS